MIGPFTAADIQAFYKLDSFELPVYQKALFRMAYACDVAHVQEDPIGSNTGREVNRVLAATGNDPGNPWCAATEYCYLLDSGAAKSQLPELGASVHGWLDWAQEKGLATHQPQRGFPGLIIESATAGHLVVVSDVISDSQIASIAGNTIPEGNPGNIREGYGVFRRKYPVSTFHCFVDLSRL